MASWPSNTCQQSWFKKAVIHHASSVTPHCFEEGSLFPACSHTFACLLETLLRSISSLAGRLGRILSRAAIHHPRVSPVGSRVTKKHISTPQVQSYLSAVDELLVTTALQLLCVHLSPFRFAEVGPLPELPQVGARMCIDLSIDIPDKHVAHTSNV